MGGLKLLLTASAKAGAQRSQIDAELCVSAANLQGDSGVLITVSNVPGRNEVSYTQHAQTAANGTVSYAVSSPLVECTQAQAFSVVTVQIQGWEWNAAHQSVPVTLYQTVPAGLWCANYDSASEANGGC